MQNPTTPHPPPHHSVSCFFIFRSSSLPGVRPSSCGNLQAPWPAVRTTWGRLMDTTGDCTINRRERSEVKTNAGRWRACDVIIAECTTAVIKQRACTNNSVVVGSSSNISSSSSSSSSSISSSSSNSSSSTSQILDVCPYRVEFDFHL